jgi:hypothetical protein
MKELDDIKDFVYNFNTKHKSGFDKTDIEMLLKNYPKINMDKFNDALNGNTCKIIDDDTVMYHCDILTAIYCGIENRDIKGYEFD